MFRARFYGLCGECSGPILPGSYVVIFPDRVREACERIHASCYVKARESEG